MHIDILTLFPDMFPAIMDHSILKKAQEKGKFSYNLVNFRNYTADKHNKVDDYPYGGGAGMVLTPQPVFDAVEAISAQSSRQPRVILMSPQGAPYSQQKAEALAEDDHLIFICGHYEGYDERIRTHLATDEVSIGDYIMTGGELGAMVVIDSIVRLLPDVLGNVESASEDSFSTGLLEHPHYTRPADFRGLQVPDILLSGHHENIDAWRRKQALLRTKQRRPELLADTQLSEQDRQMLSQESQQHE